MDKKGYVYVYSKKNHRIVMHEGYIDKTRSGSIGIFTEPLSDNWMPEEFRKKRIMTGLGEEGKFDGAKVWFSKPNYKGAIDVFFQYEQNAAREHIAEAKEHIAWSEFLNDLLEQHIKDIKEACYENSDDNR